MDKIRVMLVEDHVLVREGTRELLERQEDLIVVAEAGDGEEQSIEPTSRAIFVADSVNIQNGDPLDAAESHGGEHGLPVLQLQGRIVSQRGPGEVACLADFNRLVVDAHSHPRAVQITRASRLRRRQE